MTMKTCLYLLMAVMVAGGLSCRLATAQQSSGSISGVVQDSQGATVPNAHVSLINQEQGAVYRELNTSAEGTFFFTPVIPGTYTVTVEVAGFKKYNKRDVKLFAQDRIGLSPIVLELGTVGESINVEASSVQLQTMSAERSGVLTGNQMVELASVQRNFSDLLQTVPGFNADTQNANGLRTDQNAIAVDGTSVMDVGNNSGGGWRLNMDIIAEFKVLTNGQQAEFGRAAGSNITIVTKSGSRDFHGVGYEFYRNEWLNANSWTNNYSGLSRARNRNSTFGFNLGGPIYIPGKFNSKRDKLFFFTNWEFQRPRLFDNLVSLTVPTAAERQGDFSKTQQNSKLVTILDPANNKAPFPGNIIPQNRWNQYGLELMNVFPVPNRLGVDPGYNYQYQFSGSDSRNDRTVRVDYNISSRFKFFFRWLQNSRDLLQSGGLNVNNTIGIGAFHALSGTISGAGNLTTIITPTLTNEFNYGNTRNWLPNVPAPDSKYLRANAGVTLPLLYPDADKLANLIPNMFFGSEVTNAPNIFIGGMPYDNENPTQNITDNVAKVWAKHTIKLGLFIETSTKRQTATEVNNGRIYFNTDSANPGDTGWDFSNMLLGNFQTFDQSNTYRKGLYYYRSFEWYVQDNWKLRPNLTLDFGIRFSILQPWYDKLDQISSFQPGAYDPKQRVSLYQPTLVNGVRSSLNPLTGETGPAALIGAIVPNSGNVYNGIVTAPTSSNGRGLVNGQGVLYGPRFGLAWTPEGAGGKTVVRLGGGVFYERIQGNMIFNQINYPPELLTPKIYYGNLSTIGNSAGTLFPLNVAGLSPEGKIPTVYNVNISVQRELPAHILLDAGYVGTLNRHELARTPFNEAPFGSAWLPQNQDPTKCPVISTCKLNGDNALPLDLLRPFPGYSGGGAAVAQSGLGGGGFIATFGASGNYNALQVSANRRMSSNLTFGVAYTWSKALGTDSDYSFVGNPLNHRKADYGPLTFDRTQTLVINYVYNLPALARKAAFLNNPVGRGVLDNWQITGITSFSSGEPVVVGGNSLISLGSYNVQGVGSTIVNQEITGSAGWFPRPVLTCNPNLSRGDRTLSAYIDTSCFAPASVGSTGMDSAIRPFRGPGVNNWNISVFKRFPIGHSEGRYLQLRLETYNALNHTQWGGAVASNYEAAGFNNTPTFDATGKITNLPAALGGGGGRFGFGALNAVRTPRNVQLGAKIYF
jgi:Carboxypeptidase regulatory-like domain/TonB-dependent Receptor Plug Domain